MKLDGVLAHAFRRGRLDGRLEHGQRARRRFRRVSGLPATPCTLIITESAGTGIAQKYERVVRTMAVLPLNLYARSGRQADLDRLRIRRWLHDFSIAQALSC